MASTTILSDNGASSGSAGLKSSGGNDGVLILQTTTSGGTATNAVYVDNAQTVGVGITPSAWNSSASNQKAIQIGYAGALWANSASTSTDLSSNLYYTGAAFKTINAGTGTYYEQNNGTPSHYWGASGSASAGSTVVPTVMLGVELNKSFALQGATVQSGTGITFPATQSAVADANTLDDYEEGTWTPTMSANSGTATYATRAGNYVKVGRMVTAYVHIVLATNPLSGGVVVSGFPFVPVNSGTNNYTVGAVHVENCTINAWTWAYLPNNSTTSTLRYYVNNSSAGFVQGSQLNSNFDYMFSVTYMADA